MQLAPPRDEIGEGRRVEPRHVAVVWHGFLLATVVPPVFQFGDCAVKRGEGVMPRTSDG